MSKQSEIERLDRVLPKKRLDRDGRRLGRWVSGGDAFRVYIDMGTTDLSLVQQAAMTRAVHALLNLWPEIKAEMEAASEPMPVYEDVGPDAMRCCVCQKKSTEVDARLIPHTGYCPIGMIRDANDDLNAAIRRELGEPEGER